MDSLQTPMKVFLYYLQKVDMLLQKVHFFQSYLPYWRQFLYRACPKFELPNLNSYLFWYLVFVKNIWHNVLFFKEKQQL